MGRIYGCRFIETNEAKVFKGEDLIESSRNLTVSSIDSENSTILTIQQDITENDAVNLVGRKIQRGGGVATIVAANAADNTITIDKNAAAIDISLYSELCPGEGGYEGCPVYSTLFIGADAYGVTEVEGGGLKTIIKQLGSAGSGDPLDQRATVGWKAVKTAAILSQPFMVRLETASSLNNNY
ncbi:MAG: N4-gp56 family major capsid protein [Ruminococcaceae bacterium]|nr:N4-gp56 family major capsid protein [Oscillospiraceae bacterium]